MSDDRRDAARVIAPVPAAAPKPLDGPPSFSVVIPAYQAAATIGAAVESALAQTHRAREVIVVDDGSTDDLGTALRPFENEIDVIAKSNGGAASARNVGYAAAGGEFVAVLDADDRFHPRRLEALAELATARPDLDLVTTDARFVVNGEPAGTFLTENPFAAEDQRIAILRSCFVGGWPAARTERVLEVGGFDEGLRVAHDWDCWLRMILAGSGAGLVDLPYYDYTLGSSGLTSNRRAALWDRVRMLQKALVNPDLRPWEQPTLIREIRRRKSEAICEEAQDGRTVGGSRRRLLRLATLSDVAAGARLRAGIAALAPGVSRRSGRARTCGGPGRVRRR